jgi:HSP20 family molecular chaperone IbpA
MCKANAIGYIGSALGLFVCYLLNWWIIFAIIALCFCSVASLITFVCKNINFHIPGYIYPCSLLSFKFKAPTIPVNISEDDNQLQVDVNISGYAKENLVASIGCDKLTISGKASKQSDKKYIQQEFGMVQDFTRDISVKDNHFDIDSADTKVENGVLSIVVDKKKQRILEI